MGWAGSKISLVFCREFRCSSWRSCKWCIGGVAPGYPGYYHSGSHPIQEKERTGTVSDKY